MRRAVLLSCLLLLRLSTVSQAQCPGLTTPLMPFATETLVLTGNTVRSLTSSIYKPAGVTPSLAMVTVEGGDLRYDVVNAPTTTIGHPLHGTPPQTMTICGLDSIAAFQALNLTTDVTLTATYYRTKTP